MTSKFSLAVAFVLASGGCALGQFAGQNPSSAKAPAVAAVGSSWHWENPNKAWLANWYSSRNALVEKVPNMPHDTTSILVQFVPGATKLQVDAALAGIGGTVIQTWGLIPDLYHVAIPADRTSVPDALATIKAFGAAAGTVVYAEPDHFGRLGALPNDSFIGLQWGVNNTGQTVNGDPGIADADIDGNEAWNVSTGSTSVVVGMADSGIRYTHEDLAGNMWTNPGEIAGNGIDDDGNGRVDDTRGWDFWNNDNNPIDDNGHGTHTAGTVGAVGNNGKGVAGVCWTVRLVGLKIGSRTGSVSTTAAISAINYCVGKGIKVSNHSWSGGAFNSSLNTAITNARTAGHMLVCAAGNGGSDGIGDNNDSVPAYPASYSQDNIIAVAATNNDDGRAGFSNYGATSVDLGAPGVMIASTYIQRNANNVYVYLDGTSMAAPHVTGACALVWSVNPTWTYSQVRTKILSTVDPVSSLTGRCTTGGRLNLDRAVR